MVQRGSEEDDFAQAVRVDGEGNILVAGSTSGALDGNTNAGGKDGDIFVGTGSFFFLFFEGWVSQHVLDFPRGRNMRRNLKVWFWSWAMGEVYGLQVALPWSL